MNVIHDIVETTIRHRWPSKYRQGAAERISLATEAAIKNLHLCNHSIVGIIAVFLNFEEAS